MDHWTDHPAPDYDYQTEPSRLQPVRETSDGPSSYRGSNFDSVSQLSGSYLDPRASQRVRINFENSTEWLSFRDRRPTSGLESLYPENIDPVTGLSLKYPPHPGESPLFPQKFTPILDERYGAKHHPYLHAVHDFQDYTIRASMQQAASRVSVRSDSASTNTYLDIQPEDTLLFGKVMRAVTDGPWRHVERNEPPPVPFRSPLPPLPEDRPRPEEHDPRVLGRPTTLPYSDSRDHSDGPSPVSPRRDKQKGTNKCGPRRTALCIIAIVAAAAALSITAALLVVYLPKNENTTEPPSLPITENQTGLTPPEVSAYMKEPASLQFVLKTSDTLFAEIYHDKDLLARINATTLETVNVTTFQTEINVRRVNGSSFSIRLVFPAVSCQDAGQYRCTFGQQEHVAVLVIKRRPQVPSLAVPVKILESINTAKPVCNVISLGLNPTMNFTWILRLPNGSVSILHSKQDQIKPTPGDCDGSEGSSTLDPHSYVGMNGSDLCCQLTHPSNMSMVVFETCKKLLTIPAKFCSDKPDNSYHLYPYEPCNTFIQCANGVVYLNSCNGHGCFNLQTKACDLPLPGTTTTTLSPTTPSPFVCPEGSMGYLPLSDTYPARCSKFQRCVGAVQPPVTDECPEGSEFAYNETLDVDVVCAEAYSNRTYCGRSLLRESVKVDSMETPSAWIGEAAVLVCNVRYVTRLESVQLIHEARGELASLQVAASSNWSASDPRVSVNRSGSDVGGSSIRVTVTITNVTCADAGSYRCVAKEKQAAANAIATLVVRRRSENPTIDLPSYIVEILSTSGPRCIASSLSYDPALNFNLFRRLPDGKKEILRGEIQSKPADCNTVGTAITVGAELNGYVGWNNSEFCCSLVAPNSSNTIVHGPVCEKVTVLQVVATPASTLTAEIGKPFSFDCSVRNASVFTHVDFLRDGQAIAVYNVTEARGSSSLQGVSVAADWRADDVLSVTVNFTALTCTDAGNFTCAVHAGAEEVSRVTAAVTVRRKPSKPVLTVPETIVEDTTVNFNPVCHAPNMGHNPAATFTWLLKKTDGTKLTLSERKLPDNITLSAPSCSSSGNSSLDAQRYKGWNGSELCCQLTQPGNPSLVYEETCQVVLAVPANFCAGKAEGQNLLHPYYQDCRKPYVQCGGGLTPFVKPACDPLCIDLSANKCL